MRGTAILTVEGRAVYGYIYSDALMVRLKVWSREWATAGIEYGEEVVVRVPGEESRRMVVSSVTVMAEDESTWVFFSEPVRRRSAPAGMRMRR